MRSKHLSLTAHPVQLESGDQHYTSRLLIKNQNSILTATFKVRGAPTPSGPLPAVLQ